MTYLDAYLLEFDRETATTRKYLERAPEDKADWKPHDKSMSLGQLARHIAVLPGMTHAVLASREFDRASAPKRDIPPTREAWLAAFDAAVGKARVAILAAKPEDLDGDWTLRMGDQKLLAMPRMLALRAVAMNHLVHHRAQLGVFLRLNGVPLPSTYGPTADELPPNVT